MIWFGMLFAASFTRLSQHHHLSKVIVSALCILIDVNFFFYSTTQFAWMNNTYQSPSLSDGGNSTLLPGLVLMAVFE